MAASGTLKNHLGTPHDTEHNKPTVICLHSHLQLLQALWDLMFVRMNGYNCQKLIWRPLTFHWKSTENFRATKKSHYLFNTQQFHYLEPILNFNLFQVFVLMQTLQHKWTQVKSSFSMKLSILKFRSSKYIHWQHAPIHVYEQRICFIHLFSCQKQFCL